MVSMRSDRVPSEKRAWSSTPVLYLDRAAPFRKSRSICMKDEAYVISVSSIYLINGFKSMILIFKN